MRVAICFSICLAMAACASIPNPFGSGGGKADASGVPVDAIKAMALQIETAVQEGNRDARIADQSGITVNTTEMQQAIRTRAARSELLNQLLDTGNAIERCNGHLYILRGKAYKNSTTSRDRDRYAMLVTDEAANRWTIYEGIVDANKLKRGSLPVVQQIFHEARVQVMKNGQKYEGPAGETLVKGQ